MTISPSSLHVVSPHSPGHSRPVRAIDESASPDNWVPGQVNGAGDKSIALGQKPSLTPPYTRESDASTATIYGSNTATVPNANLTINERKQRIDAYADRVTTQIGNIESGSDGERNVKFQRARQFMEPSGYFSGGLLAAGYDPHEKIEVTFYHDKKGIGSSGGSSESEKRTYAAWEIAAGALAHDKVQGGGPINYQFTEVEAKDRSKVNDLESLGSKLQGRWSRDIATPMRNGTGELAKRSGKSDAYVLRGTLQSLTNNKDSFDQLSTEAKTAITRTLEKNGQVIIPNIYGFPLSGYAFIPYTPYDGNYEHRPNKGVMIDLKYGAVHEIRGDNDFAEWAKNNRNNLLKSFNARDAQGGKDAHWPKASEVLDSLIESNRATYPGYENLVKDQAIPVRETFNYTRARGGDYRLKYGSLDNGIASKYETQNVKNAIWSDQTEVFGASQQNWKATKEFWGNTFGYIPVVGNVGNIVFGIHDAINGKTAEDRVGGSAAAVISGLQLGHEIAMIGVQHGLGSVPVSTANNGDFSWRLNPQTSDFELVRSPKPLSDSDIASVTPKATPEVKLPTESPESFPGMRKVEFSGKKYYVAETPDAGDGEHYMLRVQDPHDPSKLAHSGIVAKPDEVGVWQRRGLEGGRWPWQRSPSPTISENLTSRFSDLFADIDEQAGRQSEKLDEYLTVDETKPYVVSTRGYEENDVLKRKLNVSWLATEEKFDIFPSEKAAPTEYSTSAYSPNFLLDLNRNDYTIIKNSKGGDVSFPLNANGDSAEAIRQNRINQFEEAIPNAELRARISEVAHQGSVYPANAELLNTLKEGYGASVSNTSYFVDYDPLKNETQVRVVAKWYLNDLTGDNPRSIPDIEATTTRTFTIRENNEVSGDAYTIDESAPTNMEVSVSADLPK